MEHSLTPLHLETPKSNMAEFPKIAVAYRLSTQNPIYWLHKDTKGTKFLRAHGTETIHQTPLSMLKTKRWPLQSKRLHTLHFCGIICFITSAEECSRVVFSIIYVKNTTSRTSSERRSGVPNYRSTLPIVNRVALKSGFSP